MSAPLQIGDTVRFSRAFLQSMAMVSGPDAPTSSGPFARGTVTAIAPITPNSPMVVATVSWADGATTQVNVTNLEVQPGNPPAHASMSRLTPESIRASQAELPPIGTVITELRRQDPYIQQEQHRYRSPRGFQSWANHLAYAALIEGGLQVMDELNDPIGFWAATTCRWARIVEAPPRFLAPELAEAFRRTPSPRLDEDFPQVLPCFRLMLPDGALFTEDKVPIPVVIVADLRAMADWLPPQAQRIGGISCVGLALDGTSYLTRHSFEQIGERNPTVDDLSHPAWQWDEQAVQSTNQRMEGLAINALLVQLYQPELLTTGPAAKVRSGKGFAGGGDPDGTVSPQGPVWIGKDFRLDRTPRAGASNSASGGSSGAARRPHWRRGHWHTVLHGEKRQSRRMQWFQPVYVGLSSRD